MERRIIGVKDDNTKIVYNIKKCIDRNLSSYMYYINNGFEELSLYKWTFETTGLCPIKFELNNDIKTIEEYNLAVKPALKLKK